MLLDAKNKYFTPHVIRQALGYVPIEYNDLKQEGLLAPYAYALIFNQVVEQGLVGIKERYYQNFKHMGIVGPLRLSYEYEKKENYRFAPMVDGFEYLIKFIIRVRQKEVTTRRIKLDESVVHAFSRRLPRHQNHQWTADTIYHELHQSDVFEDFANIFKLTDDKLHQIHLTNFKNPEQQPFFKYEEQLHEFTRHTIDKVLLTINCLPMIFQKVKEKGYNQLHFELNPVYFMEGAIKQGEQTLLTINCPVVSHDYWSLVLHSPSIGCIAETEVNTPYITPTMFYESQAQLISGFLNQQAKREMRTVMKRDYAKYNEPYNYKQE